MTKWKTKENTKPTKKAPRFQDWIFDKEKRATVAWIGSAIGIFFLVGYYLVLEDSISPSVGIGQITFALAKAALIGTALVVAFIAGTFSPAWAFRSCDIKIDEITGINRPRAIISLLIRSIAAQAMGTSLCIGLYLLLNPSEPNNINLSYLSFTFTTISAIVAIKCPRLVVFGFKEDRHQYWLSILLLNFYSFSSLFCLYVLSHLSQRSTSFLEYLLAWCFVVTFSGLFSTFRSKDLLPVTVIAFFLFGYLLYYFDAIDWPFRTVAKLVGIAEHHPVTLVLPKEACSQLRTALRGQRDIECEGPAAGLLNNVLLRNTLGDRWSLRVEADSESLVFDGRGVVIRKDKPVKKAGNIAKSK